MNTRPTRRTLLLGGASLALASIACGGASEAAGDDGSGAGGAPPAGGMGGAGGSPGTGGGATGGESAGGGPAGAGGAAPTSDAGPVECPPTRPDIEGPFFTPASPERTELVETGTAGRRLRLRGRILGPDCKPLAGAVLDFWQADDDGAYDNAGFRLRGHQRTLPDGSYELSTIVPGRYLNGAQYRPAHIHVKVYVGDQEVLTTQLYFSGDPFNEVDPWFSEDTMLVTETVNGALHAEFDFAVRG